VTGPSVLSGRKEMSAGKRILAGAGAVVLLLPLLLVAQAGGATKVSPFGFMVESDGIRLVVDAETARYQGKKPYIPIAIFIGSAGAKSITLNRGAFTLTDPSGKVSPMATTDDVKDKKNYGNFAVADDYTFIKKTIEAGPDVQSFNGLRVQTGTCFFPNVGGKPAMIRDDVELRPNGWTMALLYFANPAGKAEGTYKLTYTDPATKGVVVVPFEIQWK
jgi:hypothetical protein